MFKCTLGSFLIINIFLLNFFGQCLSSLQWYATAQDRFSSLAFSLNYFSWTNCNFCLFCLQIVWYVCLCAKNLLSMLKSKRLWGPLGKFWADFQTIQKNFACSVRTCLESKDLRYTSNPYIAYRIALYSATLYSMLHKGSFNPKQAMKETSKVTEWSSCLWPSGPYQPGLVCRHKPK